MAMKGSRTKPAPRKAASPEDVAAFLAALDHPLKAEILALRQIILAADNSIAEGVKWNTLSFRTTDYFATVHLRAKDGVQIILHRGAKVRDNSSAITIPDPAALLEWLAQDRASVKFRDRQDIESKRAVFTKVIRAWIKSEGG
jgi:hypothetical protein